MNISKLVPLTGTIPRFVHNYLPRIIRRRLLAACTLPPVFGILLLGLVIRQSDPITDLESARARWQASGITDYRIVVEFQRPYASCQQDFEVRIGKVGVKHKDTCSFGGAITGKSSPNWPTVENLFARIEDGEKNQQCGPNGCVCDGPIVMDVLYDSQAGYPQQISYTLRPDLRSRDLQYWLAMLNGTLTSCPPVTYVGQTIRVTTFEVLPPLAEQLTEATPEIGVGSPFKPETSIEGAVEPQTTPAH